MLADRTDEARDLPQELAELRQELEEVRLALDTRHTIGMAQGLVMARYDLDARQSFAYLKRQSQETNVKLRDVAARIVDSWDRSSPPTDGAGEPTLVDPGWMDVSPTSWARQPLGSDPGS